MAVIDVQEIHDGRGGELDWKRHRTYTRKFEVLCNSDNDNAYTVLASNLLPPLLATYPGDVFARVKTKRCSQKAMTQEGGMWIVECAYDSYFEMNPDNTNEFPLLRPALWTFSFQKGERAVRQDLAGNALVNSAKMPFEPPVTLNYTIPVIKIQKNLATVNYTWVADIQDTCNEDPWNGFAAGQCKIETVDLVERWENNYLFWEVTYTILVAPVTIEGTPGSWRKTKVLDHGYYTLENGATKLIIDTAGRPLGSPSLLKNGLKLPEGQNPVYLEFITCRETDWTSIP